MRITGKIVLTGGDVTRALFLENCYLDEAPDVSDARMRSVFIRHSRMHGLEGRHVSIDGQLDLRGTWVEGRLRLVNAHVGGELVLNGATFDNPGGWTLFAGGMIIDGGVFGGYGFRSRGGIRLAGAHLNGGLFLEHASLTASERPAFSADNVTVDGRMICDGSEFAGEVRMPGAKIDGLLSFDGATISSDGVGLDCRRLVATELVLAPAEPIRGTVDLGGARVSVFCDDPATWSPGLQLDEFAYDSLIARGSPGGPAEILPARARLRWLEGSAGGYRPQPYEQLAQFYRRVGHEDEARKVLLATPRGGRATPPPPGRAWGYLLDWSVGYGYRPWLAALWLTALVAAGTIVFSWKPPAPLDPGAASGFDPFVYTVNLLLPVGQFIQPNDWNPVGAERWFAYALVGTGWLLATTVLAGITRVLNRS